MYATEAVAMGMPVHDMPPTEPAGTSGRQEHLVHSQEPPCFWPRRFGKSMQAAAGGMSRACLQSTSFNAEGCWSSHLIASCHPQPEIIAFKGARNRGLEKRLQVQACAGLQSPPAAQLMHPQGGTTGLSQVCMHNDGWSAALCHKITGSLALVED